MSDDEERGHGPTECVVDAIHHEVVMFCACNYQARGYTWEEAGAEMDSHIEEMSE